MECPRCGSPELLRKGTRAGKQRYKCKNCKASFTEGVPYESALKRPPLEKECPKCHSTHVVRDGEGRYKCRTCRTRFTDNVNPARFTEKRWNCPYCGKPLIKTGTGKRGQVKYYCKSCKRTCSGDLETKEPIYNPKFKEINITLKCPDCGSLKIKKGGLCKGKPRFHCLDCRRAFYADSISKKEKLKLKRKAIKEILDGVSIREVAKRNRYSFNYLRKLVVPYYEKEKITKEQEKLLIMYGVNLNIPVEYVAPYVHCSEHYCRTFINNHKKSLINP